MSETSTDRDRGGRFVNGGKAGPGRPKGARSRFSEQFLEDLSSAWSEFGVEALRRVAVEEPSQFLKCCAMLMPRDIAITHDVTGFAQNFRQALALLGNDSEPPEPRRRLPGEKVVIDAHAIRSR